MVKLSIIIPNYNSGSLLKRCVKSIINSKENIEVIVVDDGSTDDSIYTITGIDKRIKIIKQQNSGVSSARNNGLDNATGEYILFVDSDDTLNDGWDKYLFNCLIEDRDLIIFNYLNDGNKQTIIKENKVIRENDVIDFSKKMLKNPTRYMTVWGKIFNLSVIKENHISFNENLRLAEDGDFMVQYLLHTRIIDERINYFYYYRNNKNSVMRTFDPRKVDDYLTALNITEKRIAVFPELKKSYSIYVLMHLNIMMVHEVFDIENPKSYSEKLEQLKEVIKKAIIKNAISNIKISDCKGFRMLPILAIKVRLYHVASVAFILRSRHNH